MAVHTQLNGLRARWEALRAQRWRWRPFTPPHGLYLGLPQHWPVQADDDAALADVLSAFDAWCAAHPGERCELALGSAATLWQVVPLDAHGTDAMAQAWAQAFQTWAHYLDIDLQDPAVLAQWQLHEAKIHGACLLAATPLALSQGLLDVAAAHGVKVDWMGAWWLRGLARCLQGQKVESGAEVIPEVNAPAAAPQHQAALWLTEPGCGWRAVVLAGKPTGRSAWALSQLTLDSDAWQQPPGAPRVDLVAPGAGGEQASCVPADLALLRGVSPAWHLTWSPTWR